MELNRLGNLPSEVRDQILCNLPIKEAVRTCVLSSNRRYKSAMLKNLVLDGQSEFKFANIVDHIIHLELNNCLLKLPPTFKGFRSLKSIDIEDVMLAQNAFEDLILCSPLLESLTLKRWDGFTHLKINAPNLQFLDIEGVFEDVSLENTSNLADVTIFLDDSVDETKIPGCSSNFSGFLFTCLKF
ncbi:hypothetical protein M0R45_024913 [Rubus argutus]|uniref:F-box/LRR-repeat protein 15/At3g58940/PEG3-like LRR domain-containing protein n=1 Tax=Rubus argutus TaxID=59490 RepID=A0AAW1WSE9_RUBAR